MKKLLRTVFTLVHLVLFLAMLAMLGNNFISPKTFRWLNFIPLAFPVLISLYILLTIIWILSWRKRALFFLLGFFLFFTPLRRWINYSNPRKSGELKILTYNIHGGRHITDLKKMLQSNNPDVIFMQEKGSDIKAKVSLENLPHVYEKSVLAIYSKYPIKEKAVIIDDDTNGHAIYADIEIEGKIIRFINIYLEPFYLEKSMVKPTTNGKTNQRKAEYLTKRMTKSFRIHSSQVDLILEAIKKSPYPMVLGGDFNSVPNSYEYYHLVQGMQDAFLSVGSGLGTTFHDYKFPIRIDYLFVSPTIKPATYKIDRSVSISDHYPVIATFNLK